MNDKQGLYYCALCNEVFEIADKVRRCPIDTHKNVSITEAQYIDWIIRGKPILKLRKKEGGK